MRAFVYACLVACGGGHGQPVGDATGDGPASAGSAASPTLPERLHVSTIDAPGATSFHFARVAAGGVCTTL